MSDPQTPAAPSAADLIPVTVLTGFLGSGKTTVLNHLLRQPEMADCAVLINEFGDVAIDHLLVEAVKDDVVLLNSGCLCCTVRSDLLTALRNLFLRRVRGEIPEFQRLVIETTGLADPAPILHTLMTDPLLTARYRLDGIVATVDALHGLAQIATQPEPAKQAAVADRLLITKTDLATPEALAALETALAELNPAARRLRVEHGRVDPAAVLDAGLFNTRDKHPDVARWLQAEAYAGHHDHDHGHHHDHDHAHDHDHGHDPNRHDARIQSFCLWFAEPLAWDRFVDAMELLLTNKGADILRIKGLLNVVGEAHPVVVHGVQHVFHPPVQLTAWPGEDRRSRLVLIVRDLGRPVVEDLLTAILGQKPA